MKRQRRLPALLLALILLLAALPGSTASAGKRKKAPVPPADPDEPPVKLLTPADFDRNVEPSDFLRIYHHYVDPRDPHVLVVAHRADWIRAPENSLPAIQNCLTMGVDVVEIDLRQTKDGVLVVFHDKKVDRMTDGKGPISGFTLRELQKLRLKMSDGRLTDERIPTLEEALRLIHGKAMVNLDHAYGHMRRAIKILKRTDTLKQAIFKSRRRPHLVIKKLAGLDDPIEFMPIIDFRRAKWRGDPEYDVLAVIKPYFETLHPHAIEIILDDGEAPILHRETVLEMQKRGARVWVNAMWNHVSGGHSELNSPGAPIAAWEWLIERGVTMIQTNEPLTLLTYLRDRGLHW